jgi:hypothetical protein
MNGNDSITRTQADALKTLLEESRDAQCREAKEQADTQAGQLRRQARRHARERVSKAAHEERDRLEHEVRVVEAEIETEQRKRALQRDMQLIAAGLGELEKALAARWDSRAARVSWAEVTVMEAAEVLLGREWTLEHPAGWTEVARDEARAFAAQHCGAEVSPVVAEDLDAGLRVRSKGATVDMSVRGLMANQRSIKGALLAEFHRGPEGDES